MKKLHLVIFGFLLPAMLCAETIYVSDHLVITIRSGKGSQYQIIKTAESGTRLEVLEETDEGYTMVRTPDGVEGWARTQYLSKAPIAQVKLDAAQAKLAKLIEQNKELKTELTQLRKESSQVSKEHKDLSGKTESLESELTRLREIAARPIQLDKENQDLRQSNVSLEKELQLVSQENQVLKDRSNRDWFIAGALVILAGFILGLVVPKVRWKKRSNW